MVCKLILFLHYFALLLCKLNNIFSHKKSLDTNVSRLTLYPFLFLSVQNTILCYSPHRHDDLRITTLPETAIFSKGESGY